MNTAWWIKCLQLLNNFKFYSLIKKQNKSCFYMLGAKLCLKVLNIWFKMYLKGANSLRKGKMHNLCTYCGSK